MFSVASEYMLSKIIMRKEIFLDKQTEIYIYNWKTMITLKKKKVNH